MGNNLDRYTGAGETATGPVPQADRQTADRTHDRSLNASKDVPAFQPAGPDQQLASAETNKTEVTASPVGRPSKLSPADRTTGTVKTSVTEDNARPDLPPDDSGYGPSLWTGELGTPDGSRTEVAGASRYNKAIRRCTLHDPAFALLGTIPACDRRPDRRTRRCRKDPR